MVNGTVQLADPVVPNGQPAMLSYLKVIYCLFYAVNINAIPNPIHIKAKNE